MYKELYNIDYAFFLIVFVYKIIYSTIKKYKLNFDAARLDGFNQVGLGVVCRDSQGHVFAALSQKVGPVQSVEMAEVLVARRAVVFARELSFFEVQIEGDCLRIIQALQASNRCYTLYGHIIDETKRLGSLLR